jgi:hypothetical protein
MLRKSVNDSIETSSTEMYLNTENVI